MTCCKSISKIVLVVLNLVLLLAGLVPLIIGIITLASPSTISSVINYIPGYSQIPGIIDLPGLLKGGAVYLIVLGSVITVVGFLGCCGACCENKCFLGLYTILLVLLLAAEIAIIVVAAFYPDILKTQVQNVMFTSLQVNFKDDITVYDNFTVSVPSSNTLQYSWHLLQYEAQCCGVYNYTDYNQVAFQWTPDPHSQAVVPISCCKSANPTPADYPTTTQDFQDFVLFLMGTDGTFNQEGCYDSVSQLILRSKNIVIGIFAGIAGLGVILIAAAVYLCCTISRGEK